MSGAQGRRGRLVPDPKDRAGAAGRAEGIAAGGTENMGAVGLPQRDQGAVVCQRAGAMGVAVPG